LIEWMYIIKYKTLLNNQEESAQAEIFLKYFFNINYTTPAECQRVLESYRLVMGVRNLLHLISGQKEDRFEFNLQSMVASMFTTQERGNVNFYEGLLQGSKYH
jgi:UTP:GlnB (protein PII) uridylyltransferase